MKEKCENENAKHEDESEPRVINFEKFRKWDQMN